MANFGDLFRSGFGDDSRSGFGPDYFSDEEKMEFLHMSETRTRSEELARLTVASFETETRSEEMAELAVQSGIPLKSDEEKANDGLFGELHLAGIRVSNARTALHQWEMAKHYFEKYIEPLGLDIISPLLTHAKLYQKCVEECKAAEKVLYGALEQDYIWK